MPDLATNVTALLDRAAAEGRCPGAVAVVFDLATIRHESAHGVLSREPGSPVAGLATRLDTRFDLASLTKVLATTTLVALAIRRGRLGLADPVPADLARAWPGRTLADLLEHAGGLAAHRPWYAELREPTPAAVAAAISATPPVAPARTRAIYSDLGFMVLGFWLERVLDRPLAAAFAELVAAPLGLGDELEFRATAPLEAARAPDFAPTERWTTAPAQAPHRALRLAQPGVGDTAHGVVHDDNAWALGGAAGHAGLFGTARAVVEVARLWLQARPPWLDAGLRDRLWAPSRVPGSVRRLGWDGDSPGPEGSTGGALGPEAVGHLGFTGTSLWLRPGRQTGVVLLSNVVHPDRAAARPFSLRVDFHRAVAPLAG